ncbi:hypothetical protein OUZ56_008361 [Daphnia magna]|uniref:Secreted protein n=1 Tax=Daphnia magna TaxID=35525 RepID=A0ABR0ACR5_9CRUS|nr:hypothetical protein OUZ56_008361 [Daphnia magna]
MTLLLLILSRLSSLLLSLLVFKTNFCARRKNLGGEPSDVFPPRAFANHFPQFDSEVPNMLSKAFVNY